LDTSIVRKGDFFVKRFISTRIAGGFLLRNGSLALQANHAQQAKAKSFSKKTDNFVGFIVAPSFDRVN